jgi:acyl dehydratase
MKVNIEEIDVGFELPPLSHVMDEHGMNKGEYVDPQGKKANAIHFDAQFSKEQGLDSPVATGMTSTYYANQLLTNFFGEDWLRGGSLATKFVDPMYLGETITCKAKVISKTHETEGCRLSMELWAEKSGGKKNMVGSASVLIRKK